MPWPTSAAFDAELVRSHELAQRVEVLERGQIKAVLDTVVEGGVAVDRRAAVRRTCDVRLVDASGVLSPRTAHDLLAPRGTELRLWRGLVVGGVPELVPLITARISQPRVTAESGGLVVALKGYDRARPIQRARFWSPYVISAGTNVAAAIEQLATSRLADVRCNLAATARTTPQLVYDKGDDPWQAILELAESVGHEAFFDPMGVLTTRPVLDPATQPPTWTYAAGEEAILLDAEKELDEELTYNGVIVEGENDEISVRAEAWDTDPASPTYFDPALPAASTYGPVPYFMTSSYYRSQAQAQEAAGANLLKVKGMIERIEFTAVVNPAHDAGDVVGMVRRPVADALYSLDELRIPMRRGPLQAKARARELVA